MSGGGAELWHNQNGFLEIFHFGFCISINDQFFFEFLVDTWFYFELKNDVRVPRWACPPAGTSLSQC